MNFHVSEAIQSEELDIINVITTFTDEYEQTLCAPDIKVKDKTLSTS